MQGQKLNKRNPIFIGKIDKVPDEINQYGYGAKNLRNLGSEDLQSNRMEASFFEQNYNSQILKESIGYKNSLQNQKSQTPNLVNDEFFPKYVLEYNLPDVPVKPKLFRYVDLDQNSKNNQLYKYEFSSVEMQQMGSGGVDGSIQILTDYSIGGRPNLIDRDLYRFDKQYDFEVENEQETQKQQDQNSQENIDNLKQQMNEKLKYVLQEQDKYEPYEAQKKLSNQIQISQRFIKSEKILHYGGKIEDPFKINLYNMEEIEDRVFTADQDSKNPKKRIKAIELIKKSFENVKKIKPGFIKPGTENSRPIVAKKVLEIFPNFGTTCHKVLHVMNDERSVLEEQMPINLVKEDDEQNLSQITTGGDDQLITEAMNRFKLNYGQNNGQVLIKCFDGALDHEGKPEKKLALYRYDCENKNKDIQLGKRSHDEMIKMGSHVGQAIQLEHVRNFGFSQQEVSAKNEFIFQIDRVKQKAFFSQIDNKIALIKTQRKIAQPGQVTEGQTVRRETDMCGGKWLTIGPRGYFDREVQKMTQSFGKQTNDKFEVKQKSALVFESKDEYIEREQKQAAGILQEVFKKRVEAHRKLYEHKQKEELGMLNQREKSSSVKDEDSSPGIKRKRQSFEDEEQSIDEDDIF